MVRTPGDDGLARELREANERLVLAGLRQQELTEDARRARAKLEALLDNMTEGVTVFGPDGEVVLTNPCDRILHGLPPSRPIIADDFRRCDLRRPDGERLDFDRDLLAPLLRGERLSEVEVVVALPDGGRRDLLVNGSAIVEDGATLAIKTTRDITEVRELERMRERTMAAISHDLRGPLSAAKMAAQYLSEAPTDDARRENVLGRMVRSMDRMERMLNDLLDAQRLQAGKDLQIVVADCDLAQLARDVIAELASVHGDRFELVGPESLVGVWGAEELRRALWNLATNAIKYGARDRPVTITLEPRGESVSLSVHNEGPPIPPDVRTRLFQPFSRLDQADAAEHKGGWGLGLALVRGYAEAHGGRVTLRSDESGTTFTMELPRDARPSSR